MRSIQKILLSVLAALPVASISTVAYSKMNELAGEEQNDLLNSYNPSVARNLLMKQGTARTTTEEAKKRISEKTGITDEAELNAALQRNVKILLDHGLIETIEANILAGPPSAW